MSKLSRRRKTNDDKLNVLADDIHTAWNVGLKNACDQLATAETKLFGWRKINPNATADVERNFKKQCGYFKARAAEEAAHQEIDRLVALIQDTPARSIRGLAAKAQAADTLLRHRGIPHATSRGAFSPWKIVDEIVTMALESA
jgi:hypothetical protein